MARRQELHRAGSNLAKTMDQGHEHTGRIVIREGGVEARQGLHQRTAVLDEVPAQGADSHHEKRRRRSLAGDLGHAARFQLGLRLIPAIRRPLVRVKMA